jgi:hypothetical protein
LPTAWNERDSAAEGTVMPLDPDQKAALDASIIARRRYDAMLHPTSDLPKRSGLRFALGLLIGLPTLGVLWLLSVVRRK